MKFISLFEAVYKHSADGTEEIVIVSGLHGDEPAGNMAVDHFRGLDNIHIISHINKTSRRRFDGKDLNRHFDDKESEIQKSILLKIESISPTLVIDLHEDDEIDGVYAYCSKELEEFIKKCLSGITTAKVAHGDRTDNGVIVNGKQPYHGTLERALKRRNIPYCTIEVPSRGIELKTRVDCLKEIVGNIISGLDPSITETLYQKRIALARAKIEGGAK